MRKKKYTVEVVFSTSLFVDVMAKDVDDAKDKAELEADLQFSDQLDRGLLGTSDFSCEAQEP